MKAGQWKIFKDPRTAQSAAELAIFGAILIFTIGIILRSGLNSSLALNQDLRVMRRALLASYRSSNNEWAERINSMVLLIEDRLSVDPSNKYDTRDRVPFMTQASAVHSNLMFMPVDFNERHSLPIYDIFVNGVHLDLRIAAYSTIYLSRGDIPECTDPPTALTSVPFGHFDVYGHSVCWDTTCPAGPLPTEPDPGCAVLHKIVVNHPNNDEWRPDCEECFDLNLYGGPDVPVAADSTCQMGGTVRGCFSWQWQKVYGVRDGTAGLEGMLLSDDEERNSILDVDGDFKEETVKGMDFDQYGRVVYVKAIDYQRAEYNTTWDNRDDDLRGRINVGIEPAFNMYSMTSDGTTLRLEEGQLLTADTRQYVRSTNRQDHIDVIERIFRLDPNADITRFCDPSGLPIHPSIEACGNCFSQDNIQKVCVDRVADPATTIVSPVVFVRSRIQDLRGRRWITRVAN